MPLITPSTTDPTVRQRLAPGVDGGVTGPFTSPGLPASGYLNGSADKGALAIDTVNAKLYINTGTLAATVWTVVGTQV